MDHSPNYLTTANNHGEVYEALQDYEIIESDDEDNKLWVEDEDGEGQFNRLLIRQLLKADQKLQAPMVNSVLCALTPSAPSNCVPGPLCNKEVEKQICSPSL
ncbi:hypothetical protein BY996DRAFT_6454995 [Phakopsora pachyrhizi]|nr:hypothetical protein BY996DRAFT_6454995 [Phakopsora pachyrhizi]